MIAIVDDSPWSPRKCGAHLAGWALRSGSSGEPKTAPAASKDRIAAAGGRGVSARFVEAVRIQAPAATVLVDQSGVTTRRTEVELHVSHFVLCPGDHVAFRC